MTSENTVFRHNRVISQMSLTLVVLNTCIGSGLTKCCRCMGGGHKIVLLNEGALAIDSFGKRTSKLSLKLWALAAG